MARYPRKELSTTDFQTGQDATLVLPDLDSGVIRPDEPKIMIPDGPVIDEYAKELAFMEEPVTIIVHETSNENEAPLVDVYVQGVPQFFIRGEQCTVKRKYVECLVRAKPIAISTDVRERNSENPLNLIHKKSALRYPFSIVEDRNPNGPAWLRKIMAEV